MRSRVIIRERRLGGTPQVRFTLTPKDRLVLLTGLRIMFRTYLHTKNWDAAVALYDLAQRLGKGATGRPDKVWHYYLEESPKDYLARLSKMISTLEQEIIQLQRSPKQAN
jgi:hypothetical protein